MKKYLFTLILALIVNSILAATWIKGYYKSNGTYVSGHYRTTSNNTNRDNYSTSGNTNSTTGVKGTKAPDYSSRAIRNNSNKDIKTGTRGGQYYINSKGNKVYVPKSRR